MALEPRVASQQPDRFLFALKNIRKAPCSTGGYPGVELDAGGDGRPVITHVSRVASSARPPITLAFRGQAFFFLYQPHRRCDGPRINIGQLLVTPPNQRTSLSLAVTLGLFCPDQPVYVTALDPN